MTETKKRVRKWATRTAYTQNISARLPIEVYERLCSYCKERDLTITEAVCHAIRLYLREDKDTEGEGMGSFL